MNCRNCGGAMELFATRGYFFCRYCGSFHFPETAPDQGVRVLAAGTYLCPICRTNFASAILDAAHAVQYCQTCRGVLMARSTFADVVHQRRAWATDPPQPPVPLRREELAREIACPQCSARLTTHPYYGPGNVVIDSCTSCDVIWLDFGELKQIVDAPGRDRGSRQLPPEREPSSDPAAARTTARRHAGSSTDLLDIISGLLD